MVLNIPGSKEGVLLNLPSWDELNSVHVAGIGASLPLGLVEVIFSRYKRIFGKVMQCVHIETQKVEAQLACKALNRMMSLGIPQIVKIV